MAAALRADVCEIYTDVDGVFTADPRIVPNARRLDTITYEEMLELAASGAKVLMLRCVEYARRYGIPVHVRSSYSQLPGTIVAGSMEDLPVEQAIITGVAHDRSEGKITVYGVPDRPGEAAQIFRVLADAEINIDMIVQNVSAEASKLADISFTLPSERRPDRHRGAGEGQAHRRLHRRPASTSTSARCRWSAPACARTPASPPSSSARWPTPASTSS